jgi:FkbM family methyltransferase
VDIGANFGVLTLLMSKMVGPQGIVHAFEPNPTLVNILKTTFAGDRANNVTLHPMALGSSTAEMELHVPSGNFGAASLVRRGDRTSQVVVVPVRKLDDIMLQERIPKLTFVKIDVEGFELDVLMGAEGLLRKFRPVVLFEANEWTPHDQVNSVVSYLRGYNYQCIMIPRCFVRMKTQVIDLVHPDNARGHDIVAAPQGDAFNAIRGLLNAT